MSKTNGRVSCVYTLSARSTGTHNVNANIARLNFNFSFFSFWQNGNSCSRSLQTALAFCCRNTLNTVNTRFPAQSTIYKLTADRSYDFVETTNFSFLGFHSFSFPALAFCKVSVHFPKVAHKKAGFISAGCRTDFKNNVLFIKRIRRNKFKFNIFFELWLFFFQFLKFLAGHLAHISIIFVCNHFFGVLNALKYLLVLIIKRAQFSQISVLAHCILVFFRVLYEVWIHNKVAYFLKAFFTFIKLFD